MTHFFHYRDLGDWQAENVLLIDVAPDNTASLRRLTDQTVDETAVGLPMPAAIEKAKEVLALTPLA